MGRILDARLPEGLELSIVECIDDGHEYSVTTKESKHNTIIQFGKGGRNEPNRTAGMDHQALALILIDRLEYFKKEFPMSDENDKPLALITEALDLMNARTIDRHKRGVLGNDGSDYVEVVKTKNVFTVAVEVGDEVSDERLEEIGKLCLAQETYGEAEALGLKLMEQLDEVYAFRIDKWHVAK